MIEEVATVLRSDGVHAWVATRGPAACTACAASRGCGAGSLALLFRRRAAEFCVADPLGVQIGDEVVIGLDERAVLTAALIVYLLPLLLLLAGTLAGAVLPAAGEAGAVLGGAVGLGAGIAMARWAARRMAPGTRFEATILRRSAPIAAYDVSFKG